MLLVNDLDVSQVVYQASWAEELNGGPSTLDFSLPSAQAAKFSCGDTVVFTYGGTNVFYGFLFKVNRGPAQASCTACDQLRYLKTEMPLLRQNETLSDFIARVLAQAGDRIRIGDVADTGVKLTQKLFESGSYLNMLLESIDETRELNGNRYVLRDEFGAVALRDLYDLRTGIVVGDDSLATDYSYGLSIGDNACNYVKVAKNSREEGLKSAVVAQNAALIAKWGKLAAFKTMSDGNAAQMKSLAESLLAERGKESESLSVDCIGDLRLRAGCEVSLDIAQAGLDFRALITRAEHQFSGAEHTMKLTIERSEW
ncbi:MAG TPA: hypothetical protein VN626_08670 [Clostridia bacterium]|nr:hypothetical protein [Clostridia bacterium]